MNAGMTGSHSREECGVAQQLEIPHFVSATGHIRERPHTRAKHLQTT